MAPKGGKKAADLQQSTLSFAETVPDDTPMAGEDRPLLGGEPGPTLQLSQDRQPDETEAWHPPPTPQSPL